MSSNLAFQSCKSSWGLFLEVCCDFGRLENVYVSKIEVTSAWGCLQLVYEYRPLLFTSLYIWQPEGVSIDWSRLVCRWQRCQMTKSLLGGKLIHDSSIFSSYNEIHWSHRNVRINNNKMNFWLWLNRLQTNPKSSRHVAPVKQSFALPNSKKQPWSLYVVTTRAVWILQMLSKEVLQCFLSYLLQQRTHCTILHERKRR